MLFPQDGPFFPMDKTYQSAFKPVQPVVPESATATTREEQSDDEVDIETTDEKTTEQSPGWNLKEEKVGGCDEMQIHLMVFGTKTLEI